LEYILHFVHDINMPKVVFAPSSLLIVKTLEIVH